MKKPKWTGQPKRDQFHKNAPQLFGLTPDKKTERLESKVKKLTGLVGELTVALKKTENELECLGS